MRSEIELYKAVALLLKNDVSYSNICVQVLDNNKQKLMIIVDFWRLPIEIRAWFVSSIERKEKSRIVYISEIYTLYRRKKISEMYTRLNEIFKEKTVKEFVVWQVLKIVGDVEPVVASFSNFGAAEKMCKILIASNPFSHNVQVKEKIIKVYDSPEDFDPEISLRNQALSKLTKEEKEVLGL